MSGHGRDDVGVTSIGALRAITAELDATLGPAVLDLPDGVHAHRKAVRRLRSALALVRPFFDRDRVDELRGTYRVWGRELGGVRDLEVRIAITDRHLEQGDAADADTVTELSDSDRAAYHRAHRRLVRRAVSLEALERRQLLATFLDDPPRTGKAVRKPKKALRRRLVKEGERVLRRADRAHPDDPASLHELRKAARRLRYAVRTARRRPVGLFGAKAKALGTCAGDVQDLLGEHRDALAFADHLERVGSADAVQIAADVRADASAGLARLPVAMDALREALAQFR